MEGGGELFEVSTEAMVLSSIMLVVSIAVWEVFYYLKNLEALYLTENINRQTLELNAPQFFLCLLSFICVCFFVFFLKFQGFFL